MSATLACLAGSAALARPFTVKGTDTKILRGDDLVTFTAARIRKGEPIEVTVVVDDRDDWAEVTRLNAKT